MSTSQEKLEQRAIKFGLDPAWPSRSPSQLMVEFARAELEKAAEIADDAKTNWDAAEGIRKLME